MQFISKKIKKTGAAPGTLIFVGEQKTEEPTIRLMEYDRKSLIEKKHDDIASVLQSIASPQMSWIDIEGLHRVELIEKIGSHFGIHALALEDILNTNQRPKLEEYEDYLFIVLKMLFHDRERDRIKAEQISFILGKSWLITFQEVKGDVFDRVRERIRKAKGRIRSKECDYLAYALIDSVVDHYFIVLDVFGEKIESIEEDLLNEPPPDTLEYIHSLKRDIIFFRKQIWPLREIINQMIKSQSDIVQDSTVLFLNDVYDHIIQVMDTIESYRDILSGMMDLYLSTMSNRMNEIMKLLTIMATIFIPLTFIAGIYGMNFKYMPELEWHWGYLSVWGIMIVIVCVMLVFFRKKRWL